MNDVLMRLRGIGRIQRLFGKIRARISPGPTILLYHRVAKLATDPQLLAVTPDNFEEHLNILNEEYRVWPLNDLVRAISIGKVPKNAIAITFDDGYADNFDNAWPMLCRQAIPATFYITSGYINQDKEFMSDELERLLLCKNGPNKPLVLNVAGQHYHFTTKNGFIQGSTQNKDWNILWSEDPTPAHNYYRTIHQLLRNLPPQIREDVLQQLRSAVGDDGSARPNHRPMTWRQVQELSNEGLVDIGAHTVTHSALSTLVPEQQEYEIKYSLQTIEQHLNKPVSSFAYPYGSLDSYNHITRDIVAKAGFENACSNFRGPIRKEADVFQLPRLVIRDCPGDMFQKYLRKYIL